MMGKAVVLLCHEPIAVDHECQQGWSDVWVKFKAKPGRRVYRFWPTLISKSSFDVDKQITQECATKHPELDYKEDIEHDLFVEKYLVHREIFVDPTDWGGGHLVYTQKEYIDRAEAERMITVLLNSHGHYHHFKFVWKRPKIIVIPIG